MKNFLKMSLPLIIISCLCAGILGYTFQITKEPIKEAKNKAQLHAIAEVIPEEFDNNPFAEKLLIRGDNKRDILELYPATKEGQFVGVAIKTTSQSGFGGKIELIVGFYMDGRINKFKLISHKETPGLGTKVEDTKFMTQLNGFNPRYGVLKVRQDGGDVDAVTAATISSRAVLEAIDKAYNKYQKYKENR